MPTLLRSNIDYAKSIFWARLGVEYVYGGAWSPTNTGIGTDCSGLVTHELSAVFNGPSMNWGRQGLSTEAYRYRDFGGQMVGNFPLVHVRRSSDIPPDAVMRIDLHHEGDGGPRSHMQCVLEGIVMESNGDYGTCTRPGGAMDPASTYWNDWWYLPGPVTGAPPTSDIYQTVLANFL